MYGHFLWNKRNNAHFLSKGKGNKLFEDDDIRDKSREAGNAMFSRNDPNHFNSMQFIYCIQCCCLAAT